MKALLEYLISIGHSKQTVIDSEFNIYFDKLKSKFPNDSDLGKYIRNN